MSRRARRAQLRQLLDDSPTVSEFLEDVRNTLETFFGESQGDLDGFKLLDDAIEAFEEEDDDEGDDDDETDDEEDEAP